MCISVCVRVFLGIVLAFGVAMPALPAAVRTGGAEVRESAGGLPCFTIAEREEKLTGAPSFQAITVSDISSKAPAVMWSMAMPPERTFPLMFSMCVPYAGRVASLPQQNAELLEPGKLYEVAVEVRPGDSPAQPHYYGARFCLLRRADGSNTVRMLGAAARSAAPCGASEAPLRTPHGKSRAR